MTARRTAGIVARAMPRACAIFLLPLAAGCGAWAPPPPILPPPVWEDVDPIGPPQIVARRDAPAEPFRPHRSLARGAFRFFRTHVTRHDGSRCPFVPTCSEYGRIACERHGVARGSVLAAGRLLRCHPGGSGYYPRTLDPVHEIPPLWDPVPP